MITTFQDVLITFTHTMYMCYRWSTFDTLHYIFYSWIHDALISCFLTIVACTLRMVSHVLDVFLCACFDLTSIIFFHFCFKICSNVELFYHCPSWGAQKHVQNRHMLYVLVVSQKPVIQSLPLDAVCHIQLYFV